MSSTVAEQSPLMSSVSPQKTKGYRPEDGLYWEAEAYYQSTTPTLVTSHLAGDKPFSPFTAPPNTYWVCESVQQKSFTSPPEDGLAGDFAILLTLHPLDQRIVRIGVWTRSWRDLKRVNNAMEIIAVAATGLAL